MPKPPVLFITFNKTAQTAKVLEAIAAYAPDRLYIAQDAARPGVEGEAERVSQVRQIITNITWPCEVQYRLQEENSGLQRHMEGSITWFFENEPEGIVLEDDTLPSLPFFEFVAEMLERYRSDDRVMMVGGCNLNLVSVSPYSYFFTTHPLIWGWATWASRWKLYDSSLRLIEQMDRDGTLPLIYPDPFRRATELDRIYELKTGRLQSWAYRWGYSMAAQHGVCAVPARNTVINLGFGDLATHTQSMDDPSARLLFEPLTFPLIHPTYLTRSAEWENRFFYPGQHFHRYMSLSELAAGLYRKLKMKVMDLVKKES